MTTGLVLWLSGRSFCGHSGGMSVRGGYRVPRMAGGSEGTGECPAPARMPVASCPVHSVIEYALYGAYYLQWSDTIRHTTINLYFILRGLLLPEYTILSNSSISYSYGHVTYQLYYYT